MDRLGEVGTLYKSVSVSLCPQVRVGYTIGSFLLRSHIDHTR